LKDNFGELAGEWIAGANIKDLQHLKINKKAAGRLKDFADLENLP
jgi:hypothetical protein